MEYIIIKVEWPAECKQLAEKVQAKIEEGFEPSGTVVTWEDKIRGRCFLQAMTRSGNTWEDGAGW